MIPSYSSLSLILLGPIGSGRGTRAAILAGESAMRAFEVPVVV